MTKSATNVVKGIGAVMAIGGAAALVGSAVSGGNNKYSKRKIRRTAMKAAQTVEHVLDGIQNVLQ